MTTVSENPVLAPWSGPHGGGPSFDLIRTEHFLPALDAAILTYRAELTRIASNSAAPTFTNTLEALERAGEDYRRVSALLSIFSSVMNDEAMQRVQQIAAPKQAELQDGLIHNADLFSRICKVFEDRFDGSLSAEQIRLAEYYHDDLFVRNGAGLGAAGKLELAEINQQLAGLATLFAQNVMAEESQTLALNEDELAGLPDDLVAAAANLAVERGVHGKWLIANTRSAIEPLLTFSALPDLRAKAFMMWSSRGDNDDEHDNKRIAADMLRLRARKARLLGFRSFAHWVADGGMARTPEAIALLLQTICKPALERARAEIADLKLAHPGSAADFRYHSEIARKQQFDFSEEDVKSYLQLPKLREGLFWIAGRLFGLSFARVTNLPTYHPDVELFAVQRNGQHVGLWYFDLYARPGKASGAWMTEYRGQQKLQNATPIISNNANFLKPPPGDVALLSWLDATMLFHEFGHGLHSLLSDVTYPSLSGTKVPRDFVELPSQLFERWLQTPETLSRFAVHHQTGEPIPEALLAKMLETRNFRTGFNMVELIACALLDQHAHLHAREETDVPQIERDVLEQLDLPPQIALRHRLPHFTHLFSSEGYAAGYYSYIWADVLTADGAEAFAAAPEGFFDRDVANRFLAEILSVGNSIDASEAYRRFRGRDPDLQALLISRDLG